MITLAIGGGGSATNSDQTLHRGVKYRAFARVSVKAGATDKVIAIAVNGNAIGKSDTPDAGERTIQAGGTTPGGDWFNFEFISPATGTCTITVTGDVGDNVQVDILRVPH